MWPHFTAASVLFKFQSPVTHTHTHTHTHIHTRNIRMQCRRTEFACWQHVQVKQFCRQEVSKIIFFGSVLQ